MTPEVLFVNLPPYESYYAEKVPHLGLLYVLTSLRDHGYAVDYFDCAQRGINGGEIVAKIREAAPKIIGFSVDTDNLFAVGHFSHRLRRELGPDLKIIVGGPASQGQPDEIMQRIPADVLVIGEGEHSACEVVDCLLRGQGRLEDIKGICYRSPIGAVIHNAPRLPIDDLDSLPFPDRSFLSDPLSYQATMISGRGCPFKCTFCFEGRMGNRYRHRSPQNIVAEMEQLLTAYGQVFVSINDDTFTSEPEHTLEVCRLIRERLRPKEDFRWFCEVRVDIVDRHPELVEAMAEAGVSRIQIGVESADEDVLRAYKRLNVKPAVVERVVKAFHQAGVPSIYCGFIMGGPRETTSTIARTTEFAKHLLNDVAPGSFECNASFLTPLPGTDIRANPAAYGIKLLDPDLLTSSNFNYCTTETDDLSLEMINNERYRFVAEMDREMRKLIPTLPWKVIETHFRLYQQFSISTAYNERLVCFPRLVEYLHVLRDGQFARSDDLSNEEILERFPTRLTVPIHMEGGELTVTRGPTVLKLNGLGSRIYGLCSGKLSTAEIVAELYRSLNGNAPSREVVEADAIEFVRDLDRNYAVFLKDF